MSEFSDSFLFYCGEGEPTAGVSRYITPKAYQLQEEQDQNEEFLLDMAAYGIVNLTEEDLKDDNDDIEIVTTHFDLSPPVTDTDDEKELTTSQYAMVVFRDILDSYPTDSDVRCKYVLNSDLEVGEGDFVGLFKCGWAEITESILRHPALSPDNTSKRGGTVTFRADALPKDEEEFYQLCYVTGDGSVCGASVPFQFRALHFGELCTEEMSDGDMDLIVVRSRTAVAEEKLRKVDEMNEMVHRAKERLETELASTAKQLKEAQDLIVTLKQKNVADHRQIQHLLQTVQSFEQQSRHMLKMQAEINEMNNSYQRACKDIDLYRQDNINHSTTIKTLEADKQRLAEQLREIVLRTNKIEDELQAKVRVMSILDEQHSNLKRVFDKLELQNAKLEKDIYLKEKREEELQQDIQERAETIKQQNEFIAKTLQEKADMKKEKDQMSEAFKRALNVKDDRIEGLLEFVDQLRSQNLESTRTAQDVELLREHRNKLEEKVEVLVKEVKCTKEENRELKTREEQLESTVQQLKQLVEDQQDIIQTLIDCKKCATLEEKNSSLSSQVAELRTRLIQGAEEYKKIYLEKCKTEKKLHRSGHCKTVGSSSRSGEGSSSQGQSMGGTNSYRVCPVCQESYPSGSSDLYTQHFESHTS